MTKRLPQLIDEDAPLFTVTVAANLSGMHPQTLRTYDRMGIVVPDRTRGRGRRYSRRDLTKLRVIQQLSQEEGINLTGITRILQMQEEIDRLEAQVGQLREMLDEARSLVNMNSAGARVFTAESTGTVHLGRNRHVGEQRVYRARLEITSG